jgi:cyanobactin biosynthesis protein (PatB/AcyB/McaB family)
MRLPILSAPVKRPELIQPHVCVAPGRVKELLHGANYNDPPALQHRSYQELVYT